MPPTLQDNMKYDVVDLQISKLQRALLLETSSAVIRQTYRIIS